MQVESIPTLKIGNLNICPPIIQGGMGVKVSGANLASAVANTGCAGIIASVGLGEFKGFPKSEYANINQEAFRSEIRKAKEQTTGVIGVNIMFALSNFDDLVKVAVQEDVDMIISGAGLPLNLPQHLDGKDIKLIPVVSSARTFKLICKRWKNHYSKIPDAVIVEGPMAGGHLGYTYESIADNTASTIEQLVVEIAEVANSYETPIPVIAAGGVFDGADIARFLKLGAAGVQMGTRFVCTDECDAHHDFKQAFIDAGPDDLEIIKSPVGLPGRVIKNDFVKKIIQGKTVPFNCHFHCLRSCEPKKAPYCIAQVLTDASKGKLEESFVFAGSNAYRCNEIVPVKQLVETLSKELAQAISDTQCTQP